MGVTVGVAVGVGLGELVKVAVRVGDALKVGVGDPGDRSSCDWVVQLQPEFTGDRL